MTDARRPWELSFQRAVAQARDDLLSRVKPAMADGADADQLCQIANDVGLECDRYRIVMLLHRVARPVEIVNAIVAHHFNISTNAAQLARRDSKTRYSDLDDVIVR